MNKGRLISLQLLEPNYQFTYLLQSHLYLTFTVIIMPSLKSLGQSKIPNVKK